MMRKLKIILLILTIVAMTTACSKEIKHEEESSEEYAEMTVIEDGSESENIKIEEGGVESQEVADSETEADIPTGPQDAFTGEDPNADTIYAEYPEITIEGIDDGLLKAIDGNEEGLKQIVEEYMQRTVTHSLTDTMYVEKYDAKSWSNMCGIWLKTQSDDENLIYVFYMYETKDFHMTD